MPPGLVRPEPGPRVVSIDVVPVRPRPVRTIAQPAVRSAMADDAKVLVPATPATPARWASAWLAMCQRPDLAWSSMQDERMAREHFNLSTRALRNIRHAATTSALSARSRWYDCWPSDAFARQHRRARAAREWLPLPGHGRRLRRCGRRCRGDRHPVKCEHLPMSGRFRSITPIGDHPRWPEVDRADVQTF